MKKIIFKNLLFNITKFLLLIMLSIGLIVWVVQAVNFLDFISEDGHGLKTYFSYTLLSLPKIISRILPFVFFFSVFYIIGQYEENNELLIFWNVGVNKMHFTNIMIMYSFLFVLLQVIMTSYIVPLSQDTARSYIRTSNIDYLPSLVREKTFVDAIPNLTIFIDKKKEDEGFENIFLKDKFDTYNSQVIYAKKGIIKNINNENILYLYDGEFVNVEQNNSTRFSFKSTEFNLSKFSTSTTTFPKIQELGTNLLYGCIKSLRNKDNKFKNQYLVCDKNSYTAVSQEFLKRFFKPLYIPVLLLISILQILYTKDHFNYKSKKLYFFLFGILIIVISEVSIRYAGKSILNNFLFILAPIIIFLSAYVFLLTGQKKIT